MDRNRLVIVLLLLYTIGFGLPNAINSRKLVTNLDPNPNSSSNSNQDSPLSSPPPKPNLASVETPKLKDNPNTSPSNVKSKELTDTNNKTNSSDNKLDNGKKNVENQKQLQTFDSKRCNGNPICSDQKKTMTACIQDFENGSNNLTLLVQNDRDTDVKVKIMFGTSTNNNLPPIEIHGRKAEKVNITYSGDKSTKVILNAGNGDCELPITQPKKTTLVKNPSTKNTPDHVDSPAKPKDVNTPVDSPPKVKEENVPSKVKEENIPSKVKDLDNPTKVKEENDPSKTDPKEVADPKNPKNIDPQEKPPKDVNDPLVSKDENDHSAEENLLHQLRLYSQKIEPIYGLYFGFLITVIIGGSWVFCLKKRRTDDVVPYQELEMGHPESSNAVEVETVEGWDQDWGDDDWDEDKAIRSSGGGVSKAISSNGLASRGTKKDGWDADWDD